MPFEELVYYARIIVLFCHFTIDAINWIVRIFDIITNTFSLMPRLAGMYCLQLELVRL